jgi:hypothetical protein
MGHQFFPFSRTEGPDQDGASDALGLADDVEKVVGPIREVDVSDSRGTEDVAVAHGRALVRVARRILRTVGFSLYDYARGETHLAVVGEDTAEKFDRELSGIPGVKGGL